MSTSANIRIEKLKKQAKQISRTQKIKLSEGLDKVAQMQGYDSWFSIRNAILNAQEGPTQSKPEPKTRLYRSLLNYSGEFFETKNSLRNRLERELTSIVRNASSNAHIEVQLIINESTMNMIGEFKPFFDPVTERFDRVNYFAVDISEDDFSGLDHIDVFNSLNRGN